MGRICIRIYPRRVVGRRNTFIKLVHPAEGTNPQEIFYKHRPDSLPYSNYTGPWTKRPQPQDLQKPSCEIFILWPRTLCKGVQCRNLVAKQGVNLDFLFTIKYFHLKTEQRPFHPLLLRVCILTKTEAPTTTFSPVPHTLMFMVWELLLKKVEACSEVPDSYLPWLKLDFPEELCLSYINFFGLP